MATGHSYSPDYEIVTQQLCDLDANGDVTAEFLRHFIYETIDEASGSNPVVVDTELDGSTAYAVAGVAAICPSTSVDVEVEVLCDVDANGVVVQRFLRKFVHDRAGETDSVVDTLLDGVTAYVVTGTASDCNSSSDVELAVLCDFDAATGVAVRFVRAYALAPDGTTTVVADFDLAGAAYTVVNTVVSCDDTNLCRSGIPTTSVVVCDSGVTPPAPVLLTLKTICAADGTESVEVETLDLSGAAYTPVGTLTSCDTAQRDAEQAIFCDVDANGDVVSAYLIQYTYDSTGAVVSSATFELDGTTAYVPVGSPRVCSVDGDIETVELCDDNGPFYRRIRFNADGSIVDTVDYTYDGTAYTAVGAVAKCAHNDVEVDYLCDYDATGNVIAPFIRTIVYRFDGTVVSTTDTLADGSAYVTSGVYVGDCSALDSEEVVLCDDNGAFIRQYEFSAGGDVSQVNDLDLAGAAYTVVGTVESCDLSTEVEQKILCDDTLSDGSAVVRFVRHTVYRAGAVISTFDTELDDTTAYVAAGTVDDCAAIDCAPTTVAPAVTRATAATVAAPAGLRSISVTNVSGTVTVNGVSIPVGFTWEVCTPECRSLDAVTVDATAGDAVVTQLPY